jgi:DNA-binding transcriptional regulator YiaG
VEPVERWSTDQAAVRYAHGFDRHFRGKYADHVETSRIAMMNAICDQAEYARQETAAAPQELAALRQELALSRQKLAMTQSELEVVRQQLVLWRAND